MDSSKFTVIEGNLIIDPLEAGGSFVSAEVTNTRLMGVIGVHILRDRGGDSFHQFFSLNKLCNYMPHKELRRLYLPFMIFSNLSFFSPSSHIQSLLPKQPVEES